ncbi:MAG: HTH-type transcriptional regulator GntR [Paracidovorax wautersii]|uniref:HTH-type transcriptional regulator GntR n=1 Tax=Paracidovorax wautersii TaxID=1177982 RepID=A0A7V8JNV2_9BURK|nr:MAG: HTH-type transcriptional regulator GntR [Paracidovorax wautersii]
MPSSLFPPQRPEKKPRARAGHGPTLSDVAKVAGVSPMSASRAINAPEQVSAEILAKVSAAVESTGYVANRLASSLASSRSRLVAAIIPSIAGPVFQDMVQALITELAAAGHQLILGQSGYGAQREDHLLDALIGRRPDGIVLGGVLPSEAGRKRLMASGIPVVETWDWVADPIDMVVGFSHERIAQAVAAFLIGKGCRHLAFIGGQHERAQRRAAAFEAAARAFGIDVLTHAVAAPAGVGSGREALRHILAKQPDTDAVFCSSDVLAWGVVTEAGHLGLPVPAALKVVGFGDLPFARDVLPSITSVYIDAQAIGRHAARFIVEHGQAQTRAGTHIDMGFHIIERDTA